MTERDTDPTIFAVVRADGTAAVTVDGVTQEIRAADEDAVRQQILERARQRAVIAGHPVRLTTSEPAGRWWLVVHANGQVFEDRSVGSSDGSVGVDHHAPSEPARAQPPAPEPKENTFDSDSMPWSAAIDAGDDEEPIGGGPAASRSWTPDPRSADILGNLSPTGPSDFPGSRSSAGSQPTPEAAQGPSRQSSSPPTTHVPATPPPAPPSGPQTSGPYTSAPQPPSPHPARQQQPEQPSNPLSSPPPQHAYPQQSAYQQPYQQPSAPPQAPQHQAPQHATPQNQTPQHQTPPPQHSMPQQPFQQPPPHPDAPQNGDGTQLDDLGGRHEPPPSDVLEVLPPGEEPFRKPTLDDLLSTRPRPKPGPAEWGWRGAMQKVTFGAVKMRPSQQEMQHRADVAAIQRSLSGPKTIAVVNPKGGACKTTTCYLIGATFGLYRGGYTLAWDNNETRGTLGWRSIPARHTNTAVDLLADIERFQAVDRARVGDLDNYVRTQGTAQFDVLASDEDAARSATLDGDAFDQLHQTLSRFYRLLIIDTGNNMRASNWIAAVESADLLVISSSIREDTASSAAWLVDGLRSRGMEEKIEQAVTVLSSPARDPEVGLSRRLHDHFGRLTRAVLDVPHDPALVEGGTIEVDNLHPETREAWVHVTAAVADGL